MNTQNPWERLREAAKEVAERCPKVRPSTPLVSQWEVDMEELREALAALPATPPEPSIPPRSKPPENEYFL